MTDQMVRELERHFQQTGTREDELRLLRARLRAGELTKQHLEAAWLLGHPLAGELLGHSHDPSHRLDGVAKALAALGSEAILRGALAAAELLVEEGDAAARERLAPLIERARSACDTGEGDLIDPVVYAGVEAAPFPDRAVLDMLRSARHYLKGRYRFPAASLDERTLASLDRYADFRLGRPDLGLRLNPELAAWILQSCRKPASTPPPAEPPPLDDREAATTFESTLALRVLVEDGDGELHEVGRTPGTIAVPPARRWWVRPTRLAAVRDARWRAELTRSGAPGLHAGSPRIAAADLEVLADIPTLRWLCLRDLPALDEACVDVLLRLQHLEHLDLVDVPLVGIAPRRWSELRHLTSLDLRRPALLWRGHRRPALDAAALRGLASLRLRALGLRNEPLTSEGLAAVGTIHTLESLDLRDCLHGGRAISLEGLAGLTGLRRLDLSRCELDDAQLATLPLFQSLTWLSLRNAVGFSLDALERLARLPALRVLDAPIKDARDERHVGLRQLLPGVRLV